MTVAAGLDPKFDTYKKQIVAAFSGAAGPGSGATAGSAVGDSSSMAASLLAAYQGAAAAQPAKAFKAGKGFTAQISDPMAITQKAWWDDVWSIVQTVAPAIIDAVSKDYQPPAPDLKAIIQALPEARRNDPDFADYATTLALTLGQGTVQAMSGSSARPEVPPAPAGKDKGWFDDVCSFVSNVAPVVLPIALSLL